MILDNKKFKVVVRIIFGLYIFFNITLGFPIFYINKSTSSPLGIYMKVYTFRDYRKGDYIVYRIDERYKEYMLEIIKDLDTLKKIEAVNGDKIHISNNKLYINGVEKSELKQHILRVSEDDYSIKENEYFTLSNNEYSLDSRYYGVIKKENIKYRVIPLYIKGN